MDLQKAVANVKSKIEKLNIDSLEISPYNKRYLKNYRQNIDFFLDSYKQLIENAISKSVVPVSETVFLDYGGGSGLMTYLAVALGFKKVIYNDLYVTSADDVKVVAKHLNLYVDNFIVGDIADLIAQLKALNIQPNLICSFDVLEHIYDTEAWFSQLKNFNHPFQLFFKTGANGSNPLINRRLKRLHLQAELKGFNKKSGWKDIDLASSYLAERQKIIMQNFPDLEEAKAHDIALKTRGLRKDDILKQANNYIATGNIKYKIKHPTNTCDPYTGNWTEKIIDTKELCKFVKSLSFDCQTTNSYYSYSEKAMLNIVKYALNLVIRILGKSNLFFSPSYTVEVKSRTV